MVKKIMMGSLSPLAVMNKASSEENVMKEVTEAVLCVQKDKEVEESREVKSETPWWITT